MRQRHLLSVLKFVGGAAGVFVVLTGVGVLVAVGGGRLPVSGLSAAAVAAAGVVLVVEASSVWRRMRAPRSARSERRAAVAAYKEIERLLDSMGNGRRYEVDDRVEVVSTGTRWRPRLTRYVVGDDAMARDGLRGEVTAEFIVLWPAMPKAARIVRMIPVVLRADGWLVRDEERFARTAGPGNGGWRRVAGFRMAVESGLIWMSGDDLRELAEQLGDAVAAGD
uniref:hypothetical protein n=1 Tax=Amycolatopsis sp. CA-096443 TaxID=3239919 RepID=UPI003F49414F